MIKFTKKRKKKKIQSSIPSLSVGDERKCFNQIRKASAYIKPESLLWNGWPAGKFALDYVIGHHTKRKKKAEEKLESIPETLRKKKRRRNKIFDDLEEIASLESVQNTARSTFVNVNMEKKGREMAAKATRYKNMEEKEAVPFQNNKRHTRMS